MFVQLVGAGNFVGRVDRCSVTTCHGSYSIILKTLPYSETRGVDFGSNDLASLAKLLQILLSEITLDGNITPPERCSLRILKLHIDRAMNAFESDLNAHLE